MARTKKNPGHSFSGIWYYVYLKPNWILMRTNNGMDQHIYMWPNEVVPELKGYYGLSKAEVKSLEPLYASMPRGRIVDFQYGTSFEIVHGGDFPKCMDKREQIELLRETYNLPLRTKNVVHDHEKMIAGHKSMLQSIIGKVVY